MSDFIKAGVLAAALAAALVTVLPSYVLAQAYPAKPVRVFVASSPGGYVDRTSRIVADKLSQRIDRKSTRLNSSHT